MGFMMILASLLFNGVNVAAEKVGTRKEAFTQDQIRDMMKMTTGKSKREAAAIIRRYGK